MLSPKNFKDITLSKIAKNGFTRYLEMKAGLI